MTRKELWCRYACVVLLSAGFAVGGGQVRAEEGIVKAVSAFAGEVELFKLEDDQTFAIGIWDGMLFIDDGTGALDAAALTCPGTVEANLNTGERTGTGRCIITGASGDRVYAKWTCQGDLQGCKGPFTITGGTGEFHGISGTSTMVVRIAFRELTGITSEDSIVQMTAGLAAWPQLRYKIP